MDAPALDRPVKFKYLMKNNIKKAALNCLVLPRHALLTQENLNNYITCHPHKELLEELRRIATVRKSQQETKQVAKRKRKAE